MNKGEPQYYDYSIAVSSTSLLALTHVPNLVAAPVWFVRRTYGESREQSSFERRLVCHAVMLVFLNVIYPQVPVILLKLKI